MTIQNCIFDNNHANVDGGAIFAKRKVTITDSQFTNNKAYGATFTKCYGGAICTKDELVINGSKFNGNSADNYGGAIYSYSNVYVDGTEFVANTATKDKGGAIYAHYVSLNDCSFDRNGAKSDGGAIYSEGQCLISNSKFTVSTSESDGGAVYAKGIVTVSNSSFSNNNVAGSGGAIYASDSIRFGQTGSYFFANQAQVAGGAIHASKVDGVVANCTFRFNSAPTSSAVSTVKGYGGAIFINDECSVSFIANSFIYNSAAKGGSAIIMYAVGSHITLKNNIFANNNPSATTVAANQYDSVDANWYGTNEFDSKTIFAFVKHNYGGDREDKNALNVELTIEEKDSYRIGEPITLKVTFIGDHLENELVGYDATFTSNQSAQFVNKSSGSNSVTVKMIPNEAGQTKVTAVVNSQLLTFNLTVADKFPSSVKIDIDNLQEFSYKNISIPFTAMPRTDVRAVIINSKNMILLDEIVDGDVINIDLPAGETYRVTITNLGNATVASSMDVKEFTVKQITDPIIIDAIEDVEYGSNVTVSFKTNHPSTFNIMVYKDDIIFVNFNTAKTSMTLSNFEVGCYTVVIRDLGNENYTENMNSTTFNIKKADFDLEIFVSDCRYPDEINGLIYSSVDGLEFNVTVNETTVCVKTGEEIANYAYFKFSTLPIGNYTAKVSFAGNDYYNPQERNASFKVAAELTEFSITANATEIDYGNLIEITHSLPENATGTIRYYLNNGTLLNESSVKDKFVLPVLNAGQYIIIANYTGDENYTSAVDTVALKINKVHVTINVEPLVVIFGEVVINITSDVDGNYSLFFEGSLIPVKVEKGVGTTGFGALDAGEYEIFVENSQTINYEGNATVILQVVKDTTKINVSSNDVNYPDDVIVTVSSNVLGTYLVRVGNQVEKVNIRAGEEIQVIFKGLDINEAGYVVNVTFDGNENFASTFNDSVVVKVLKRDSGIKIDPIQLAAGDSMLSIAFPEDATGNLTLTFADGTSLVATVANGSANIKLPDLAVGDNVVAVSYSGDENYAGFNQTTTLTVKSLAKITGNKNVNTYYGKNYSYKLRIFGDDGKVVGVNVAVKVTINGKAKTLKTDKNGYITIKFDKTYLSKTYNVIVQYNGVKVSNKIKVQKVLTLKKVKVKKSAKKLVLKATLKEGKKAIKGKKLIFKFKGKKYSAKTNKKGVAKVTIKKSVLKKLKVGKKVKYQVTYLKCTVKKSVKVKK